MLLRWHQLSIKVSPNTRKETANNLTEESVVYEPYTIFLNGDISASLSLGLLQNRGHGV